MTDIEQKAYDDMIRKSQELTKTLQEWEEQFYYGSEERDSVKSAISYSLSTTLLLSSAKVYNHSDKKAVA